MKQDRIWGKELPSLDPESLPSFGSRRPQARKTPPASCSLSKTGISPSALLSQNSSIPPIAGDDRVSHQHRKSSTTPPPPPPQKKKKIDIKVFDSHSHVASTQDLSRNLKMSLLVNPPPIWCQAFNSHPRVTSTHALSRNAEIFYLENTTKFNPLGIRLFNSRPHSQKLALYPEDPLQTNLPFASRASGAPFLFFHA